MCTKQYRSEKKKKALRVNATPWRRVGVLKVKVVDVKGTSVPVYHIMHSPRGRGGKPKAPRVLTLATKEGKWSAPCILWIRGWLDPVPLKGFESPVLLQNVTRLRTWKQENSLVNWLWYRDYTVGWTTRIRFPPGAMMGFLSSPTRGPALGPIHFLSNGYRGLLPRDRATGAWCWRLASI
jgi:hypothetical protein